MRCRSRRSRRAKTCGKMSGHYVERDTTTKTTKWSLVARLGLVLVALLELSVQAEGSHLPPGYLSLRGRSEEVGDTLAEVVFEPVASDVGILEDEVETTTMTPIEDEDAASTKKTEVPTSTPKVTTVPTTEGLARRGVVNEDSTPVLVGPNGKRYLDISANCDSNQMFIVGQFLSKFKGRIYSLGYPDENECGKSAFSDPGENVTFSLPLGQCGVQMMGLDPEFDSPKRHEVTLYIQYSSFLQQVIDDKVSVSCVEIHRSPLEESMQMLDFSSNEDPNPTTSRQARRMMGSVKDTKTGKPISPAPSSSSTSQTGTKISSKIGESWMEILHGKDPSPKSRKMLPVAVGQDVTLVISTKVMRGYDARIVNCSANDGTRLGSIDGFRSQQILDSAGCSVDTSMVAYCQGPCPQEPCDSGLNHFGTWRDKYGRIADALVDTAEIVNSVEVYAPELEDAAGAGGANGGDHHFERHQSLVPLGGSITSTHGQGRHLRFSDTKSAAHSSSSSSSTSHEEDDGDSSNAQNNATKPNFLGGSSVCVSPGSIILALVILGVVLVISATATLWFALKRSEARKYRQAVKHAPFTQQHTGVQPYYRFSHW
ncbi:hypothetical protein Fcan01_21690 [Folsomia candida]|uniref:ZP domain-containing protein n=1 Tax=Folsomia candida TaxID=158441 RepID=A0A226DFW6_FOLCA|nr:hypothetical protein Fcan01_21690 [Folsomia candida]